MKLWALYPPSPGTQLPPHNPEKQPALFMWSQTWSCFSTYASEASLRRGGSPKDSPFGAPTPRYFVRLGWRAVGSGRRLAIVFLRGCLSVPSFLFLFSVPLEWRLNGPEITVPTKFSWNRMLILTIPDVAFLLSRGLAACAQTPSCQRKGCYTRFIRPKSWEAKMSPEEVSDMMMELGTWHLWTPFFS